MKKYLPLVTVSLLIAGSLLCLNFRTLKMLWFLNSNQCMIDHLHPLTMSTETAYDLNKVKLSPDERTLVDGILTDRGLAWYKTLAKTHPEDKFILAACIRNPWGIEGRETEYLALFSQFRKLDPGNAFPDYCEALMLFDKALKTDWKNNIPVYTVRNRALLEQAGKMFLNGMKKPFFNGYVGVLQERVIRLLQLKDEPFDWIRENTIRCRIPLSPLRMLSRYLLYYAEVLHKEGRESECRAILRSGPQFLRQIMEHDGGTLIEMFGDYHINRHYLECARKIKDERAVALYQKADDFFQQYRSRKVDDENIKLHGGFLCNMLLAGLKEPIPTEELTPERKINYLVIDFLAMAGFCAGIWLLWLFCAVIALCKRSERVTFSPKLWLQFIGYGMILPQLCFLFYTHLDFLCGRMFYVGSNLFRTILGIALLFLLWIPLAALVRHATQGEMFAVRARAMLLPLALLLFLTGIVLRPLLDYELRSYWQQDTLFRGSRFSATETKTRDYLAGRLKMLIQEGIRSTPRILNNLRAPL